MSDREQQMQVEIDQLRTKVAELEELLDTPLYNEFIDAVKREAGHQIKRWRSEDKVKEPQDWFWTLGFLSGKAVRAHLEGDRNKALHHTISSAAMLLNWHRKILSEKNAAT